MNQQIFDKYLIKMLIERSERWRTAITIFFLLCKTLFQNPIWWNTIISCCVSNRSLQIYQVIYLAIYILV